MYSFKPGPIATPMERAASREAEIDALIGWTEKTMVESHTAKPFAVGVMPEGALELVRLEREIDRVVAPGTSIAKILLTRYAEVRKATQKMSTMARLANREMASSPLKKLVLAKMDAEVKAFAELSKTTVDTVRKDAKAIAKSLQADLDVPDIALARVDDVVREVQIGLKEMQQKFTALRRDAEVGLAGRPAAELAAARSKAFVTQVAATADVPARSVMSYRIKGVTQHLSSAPEMARNLGKRLKQQLQLQVPEIGKIEDSSLFFLEALGLVAIDETKTNGALKARILRKFAEQGEGTLTAAERARLQGYLSAMRGLLPEQTALQSKYLESLFHKSAFEILSRFPPDIRKNFVVEVVEGPMWSLGAKGPARQFGDGCMLITSPSGESAIVGLNEIKAGYDEELLKQLFDRSDRRAVGSQVTFLGRDNKPQTRRLTREFAAGKQGELVEVTPIYAYGRTSGESPETAQQFQAMVEDQMRTGREVWKVPLPLTAAQNELFTRAAVKEAVLEIVKKKPKWGK